MLQCSILFLLLLLLKIKLLCLTILLPVTVDNVNIVNKVPDVIAAIVDIGNR